MCSFRFTSICLLFVAFCHPVAGQELDEKSRRLDYLKQAIGRYEVRVADGERAAKLQEPVLRWNDSVISVLDGIVVVWTDGGRPVATADVWVRASGETHHVFQSLSEARVTAQRGDQRDWHPQQPGIRFQLLPDTPQPHASKNQRLNQMRELATKFAGHVIDVTSEGGRIELRLMPQPILRYEAREESILDGGLFVLAKDTNPEVILLLEAVELTGGRQWRFAAAPKTNRKAEVRFNDNVVFTSPYVVRPHDPDGTFFGIVEQGPAWKETVPESGQEP